MGNSLRVYASLFMLALLSLPLALPAALGQPMMGPMAGYMEFQSTNVYYPEAFYNRYEVNASMPAANMTGVDALLELSAFYSNGSLDGSLELNVSGPEFNATGSVSLDLMVAFTLNESNTSLMLSVFIDNSQFVPPGNGSLVLNVTVEADTRSRVDFVEGVQESAGTFTVWFSDKGDIARGAGVEELSVTVEGSFESTQNATHASFEVNATIDVDTDPPQAAPGIAFILSLVLQNLAQQLPPGVTMEVSISQEDPSVVIVRIYGTVELEAGLVMPGMPVEPPVPIEQIPQPQFNGSVIPVPGFESGSVSFSLDAAIEPSSATASATLSATI
ncbi:MAG: hypothetical protein LRS43_01665, partial [Desulfurococcales archaeon]|nr:hypothetical protein [Desulfurococcales archaeon]